MSTTSTRRTAFAAVLAAAALSAAACSSSGGSAGTTTSTTPTGSASPSVSAPADTASAPFGPACASVPTSGSGSFAGMAADPVATAASNNQALSTLVTAVGAAGLGDTFNGAQDITVLAPANSAFEAMDQETLKKALADPKGLLSTVLTYHVIQGRLQPRHARWRAQDPPGRHGHDHRQR